ncbi:unnamed protein product [Paramecium pentaurelia]|uniref:Uncharacterized protein n=1 Tax=Paramecium pentaurelia TaxID=43138 RepID=A0A8S1W3K0_9CILI|nr:unnamed protein product [Paramecium pentaurelia]
MLNIFVTRLLIKGIYNYLIWEMQYITPSDEKITMIFDDDKNILCSSLQFSLINKIIINMRRLKQFSEQCPGYIENC